MGLLKDIGRIADWLSNRDEYSDLGSTGERFTYNELKSLYNKKLILRNVYIKKQNGELTEIDLLLITLSGIFVIESKNYSGWIFGDEAQSHWMQTLKGGFKFSEVNMDIQRCVKESFIVIGKEGSTNDGEGFIQKLWADANSHYGEISALVKTDDNGRPVGFWGAMSDLSRSFNPWENGFTEGLYIAGAECKDGSEAPDGWTKWVIPSYEYIYIASDGNNIFSDTIKYLNDNNIALAGAVHDFTCPETGKSYMFFPIRRL